ncbi:hypothetical protein SSP35_01_05550 [Streptomyces sp. NBRC 110611]|uniref:hypothetical protein n=1 Tax=Streptomyces sp. NBRC 110611 TaxID=1621259 RepID=UPI00085798F2|nr:hypothetical protein [Streptomyces sp. NBRC 110611]GAU65217.1 hypothetical protein SSP35_01_05550 [Streptomyces sp. NBRC 110611]
MSPDREQPGPPRPQQSLMTLRVYTTGPDGSVREERGQIRVLAGEPVNVYGLSQVWPPCACPRHRGRW